jgi:hypothetical protein
MSNDLKLQILELERQMKALKSPYIDHQALQAAQKRADAVMSMTGRGAPPPAVGEHADQYRRRLLSMMQKHSPTLANANVGSMDSTTLAVVEDQIYQDAAQAAYRSDSTPGVLRAVEERDVSGRLVTRYVGDVGAFIAPFVPHDITVCKFNRS